MFFVDVACPCCSILRLAPLAHRSIMRLLLGSRIFSPRPCRNAMANVSVQTHITLVPGEPGGDATLSVVEARCVATPLRNAASAVAAEKSMRPAWLSNTRRGGGRDKSPDAHWTHHHRCSQTERVWIYPCADDVPRPRKLLRGPAEAAVHPSVLHVRKVLRLAPLHRRPLPLAAWRLLLRFGAGERSFSHFVIPRYADDEGFVLCVGPG